MNFDWRWGREKAAPEMRFRCGENVALDRTVEKGAVTPASRTSEGYWDSVWQDGGLPKSVDPRSWSLRSHVDLQFDKLFRDAFRPGSHSCEAPQLLELGCARSIWLPYFSKEFGFRVAGIDYSSLGCDQAKAILKKEKVDAEIIQADIFKPATGLLGRFDYVISFGLVEHFESTSQCLKACAAFLRPGGKMITVIPNMNGAVGVLQRWLAREVYDVHVPLDSRALSRAHEAAGLEVLNCGYFCFLNFGVLNLERIRRSLLGLWLSRSLIAVSAVSWIAERAGIRFPPNELTSPYIVCSSMKDLPA